MSSTHRIVGFANDSGTSVPARPWRRPTLRLVISDDERKTRLAYALRHAREARGISVPDLAAAIHRTKGTVYDWEAGRSAPSLLDLGPLCDELGVKPSLFTDLPAQPAPTPSPVDDYLLVQEATERGLQKGLSIVKAPRPRPRKRAQPPASEGSEP